MTENAGGLMDKTAKDERPLRDEWVSLHRQLLSHSLGEDGYTLCYLKADKTEPAGNCQPRCLTCLDILTGAKIDLEKLKRWRGVK